MPFSASHSLRSTPAADPCAPGRRRERRHHGRAQPRLAHALVAAALLAPALLAGAGFPNAPQTPGTLLSGCLLYTSDAADE